MADNDRDYNTANKSDGVARALATIALILSILALIWAAKADKRAGDAIDKANSVSNSVQR